MNIVELLQKIGVENVQIQNLDNCADSLDYSAKRGGTKITFGTDVPLTLEGTSKLGMVVWLDRDAVRLALAGSPKP